MRTRAAGGALLGAGPGPTDQRRGPGAAPPRSGVAGLATAGTHLALGCLSSGGGVGRRLECCEAGGVRPSSKSTCTLAYVLRALFLQGTLCCDPWHRAGEHSSHACAGADR